MKQSSNIKTNTMNKTLLLLLLFTGMASAQIINFPDPVFKAKLLAADASNNIASNFFGQTKIDTNNNGEIEVSEAVEIYSLNVSASGITNLTGISEFTSLQILNCENNQLTTLDASNLSSLIVLVCSNNQLTSLNISGMFNLEALECSTNQLTTMNVNGLGLSRLRGLSCSNNKITSVNVSGVSTLENLSCSNNLLTALNVSGLGNLKSISCGDNKLTALSIASLSRLEILWCYNNLLATLNITGAMTSLHELNCSTNQLTALNIPTAVNLEILRCSGNQLTALNTTNLVRLKIYECGSNLMPTLNVTGLPLLEYLDCSQNKLTSLTVANLSNLKGLGCNNNLLTTIDFTGLNNLENLGFGYNAFPTADLTMMPNLKEVSCYHNQLTSLNISGLVKLEQILCMNNLLPTLDATGLTNLKTLWCDENKLTSINVSGLLNLAQFSCSDNLLPALNVSGLTKLWDFSCQNNLLPTLDVSGLTSLISISCGKNLLTELNVSGLNNLATLSCFDNFISELNVSGLTSIQNLYCANNKITALDLTGFVNLKGLDCSNNLLSTLDVSDSHNFAENFGVSCQFNLLTTLFVKNGQNEYVNFNNNPNLTYICADEGQIADLQLASTWNNPATVISSYCSFTPGGSYNSVTGTARYDLNNNGCEVTDIKANNVRFDMSDGNISSGTFLNNTGIYELFAGIGNYTLNANLENPAYFNITPTTTTHQFPALNSTVINQDFCLTANGPHKDAEIVLYPTGVARPGFDAQYRLVYKNKGNQTLSGSINLVFEDAVTDFVSADPVVESLAINTLTWNYTNLLPFETRTIDLILNINSPEETPAVHANDVLHFTATMNPVAGDDLPADNVFNLNQMVVNSMDPNDIACLEGENVAPSEIGKYLHYVARFENTGNHEAENVVVKVIIDNNKYDIKSLQLLDNSHPSYANITGNKVEFVFKNIRLAPIAGDPPVGGHGTVLFKIKTLPLLNAGDEVSNKANIFFDYNAPIETNDARTIFALLSKPEFVKDESIILYPNPARDFIKIDCDNSIQLIELFDIQGRILETIIENKNTSSVDISGKAKGVYFVRITTENGKKVEKVIKE